MQLRKILPCHLSLKSFLITPSYLRTQVLSFKLKFSFSVDTSEAGKGQIQVDVQGPHSRPKTRVTEDSSPGLQVVTFNPKEEGMYTISITFNKEDIPDSPFKCHIYDLSRLDINLDYLNNVPATQPIVLRLATRGAPIGEVDAHIVDAYNHEVPVAVKKRGDMFEIEFTPQEVGTHTLTLTYKGIDLAGSPHSFNVYNSRKVKLQEVPTGGIVGQESAFLGIDKISCLYSHFVVK